MKKKHKELLFDLNKIARHFKLKLSKVDAVKNTAFAIDNSKRKLLFISEDNLPYFKTIDLRNVDSCTLKLDRSHIDTEDLKIRKIDDAIVKVQLQISHVDPLKSLIIEFYDSKDDHLKDLQELIEKATYWRDSIAAKLPAKLPVRA
jgi:hypothetical protein